jgi:hypothetical protein
VSIRNALRRAAAAINTAATWILASEKRRVIKAIVVLWVVVQSLLAPAYTFWKERAQAEREGLNEAPQVMVLLNHEGRCTIRNGGPRPIVHVEIRRFLHSYDPAQKCNRALGPFGSGVPDSHAALIPPGERLVTDARVAPNLQELDTLDCKASASCIVLMECEARYHRAADLKQFEKVAIGGLTDNSKIEFPIVDIKQANKAGGGSTWNLEVRSRWKSAFQCAHEQRTSRKALDGILDQFLEGIDKVV